MMQPGHAMIVEAQEDALDPLAAVGEACGQFAIECSDVAGHVNRVAERIRANTVLLSRLRATPVRSSWRSEEHTSELQSLMRISYAVFCLKKNNKQMLNTNNIYI